jgi:3-methyladenine DNA glycosylase AlkD
MRDLGRPISKVLLELLYNVWEGGMRSIELVERKVLSVGIPATHMLVYAPM